jgi:hypothetical protein
MQTHHKVYSAGRNSAKSLKDDILNESIFENLEKNLKLEEHKMDTT